ncbi:hypothetical protein EBT31_09420, partial [bacterium]|nr:hypothetical protein [bacterium]
DQYQDDPRTYFDYVATEAAQWGADQELKACCEWLEDVDCDDPQETAKHLRAARRPKLPSLKEQAQQALGRFSANAHINADEMVTDFELLRRAVEKLDD